MRARPSTTKQGRRHARGMFVKAVWTAARVANIHTTSGSAALVSAADAFWRKRSCPG
ncbi:MAG: hypothetical protein E5V79_00605 [Mesorhizobium sp.]|nr:hypothetical protein EJ069_27240 [Mesorhizobium sp. M2A.F.Ca.ET.043.05.1.1]TIV75737.1 MAG: hypothetical protein E5V79_00605 [Mesorhizobium sp.]